MKQIKQILSIFGQLPPEICNLKIRSGSKTVCGASIILVLKRNYDFLKWKSPCILLNKNIGFNKNETESKLENLTHSFRETNFVLQLIQESKIKSKTVVSWSLQKKKEGIFWTIYFAQRKNFQHLCFISM